MMKDILKSKFVIEMCETATNMYRLGWDERNGGNISCLLTEDEVCEYLSPEKVLGCIPLGFDGSALSGKVFLVTGTGKYFKNIASDPETNLGIIRISDDGNNAEVLWGFKDGGRFTSELPTHIMTHVARLEVDPDHRVVVHSHPTNTLAMTRVHPLDAREFTRSLWQTCSECIMVFPDGIGVLPWMVCGTNEIGVATADLMKAHRLVIWGIHGIYGTGNSLDEAFGLIETVEKAAQLYMLTAHLPILNTITDDELKALAESLSLNYRKDYLNI